MPAETVKQLQQPIKTQNWDCVCVHVCVPPHDIELSQKTFQQCVQTLWKQFILEIVIK